MGSREQSRTPALTSKPLLLRTGGNCSLVQGSARGAPLNGATLLAKMKKGDFFPRRRGRRRRGRRRRRRPPSPSWLSLHTLSGRRRRRRKACRNPPLLSTPTSLMQPRPPPTHLLPSSFYFDSRFSLSPSPLLTLRPPNGEPRRHRPPSLDSDLWRRERDPQDLRPLAQENVRIFCLLGTMSSVEGF